MEWCGLCPGSWDEFLFALQLYAKFLGSHKLFFLANPKRATPAKSIENDNEGNHRLRLTRMSRSFSHFSFRTRRTGGSAREPGPRLKSFFRKLVSYSNLGWLPHQGLLLAFALPLPLASGSLWRELLAGFQGRGVAVLGDHPRCAEPNLEGLYVRGRREVVVCRRGDPAITLRHEGWHLVQSLCLGGGLWLPAETVTRQLGRRDRREVQALVPPAQWPREAEARVMARLAPGDYFQALDQACAGRLSPPPASPDRPESSR